MRFHLTSEQVAIQDAVRGTIADNWPKERMQAFADSGKDFDEQSWQALMALGVPGILTPDSGMGLLDAALVCEVAGEGALPGPLIGQLLTVAAVGASASETARSFLDGLIDGGCVAAVALDGEWVQSASAAHVFLALADDGSLRLVEAGAGVEIEPGRSTDRSRPVSRVSFGKVISHKLCEAGDPLIARIRDAALVLIAADCLGGAQHCTDVSVAYAKERTQFGQPIGRFQGLKHQLAQMALDVEPARALVWYAAFAWDEGLADAPRSAALAKAHLCDIYTRTTRAAIAAHGGIGYTWEYGLHHWFRRSIQNRVWLGTPSEHRARVADW